MTSPPKIRRQPICRLLILPFFLLCISTQASVNLVEETANALTIEFTMPPAMLRDSGQQQKLDLSGVPRLQYAGQPDLPFFVELIAVPHGTNVSVEVLDSHFFEYQGVDYTIAESDGPAAAEVPYEWGVLWPQERAAVEYVGILRGVSAHALRIYPVAYDGHSRTLMVFDRMTISIRFDGGSAGKRLAVPPVRSGQSLLAPFLNSPGRYGRRSVTAKPTQLAVNGDWYDPTRKWVKVRVDDESIHRIDRAWLERLFLDVDGIDPRTLRLFLNGEEQTLYVEGEEDGSFDEADFVLFFGRTRRFRDAEGVERDHDSIYGRRNIYWLTWGDELGKRFTTKSGAPVNDYPVSEWYWATSHFEFDRWYDELEFAPDPERDHWFELKIEANEPGAVGSKVARGEIFSAFLEEEYSARLRHALRGWSSPGHHTVVSFNGQKIKEVIWEGQVELVIDEQISSSLLSEDEPANRLTVQAIADQYEFDKQYHNWWQLQYRRRYDVFPGRLAFPDSASAGRRATLRKFTHPNIVLFDIAADVRIVDALIEPSPDGLYVATFEDASSHDPFYVTADSLSTIVPRGFVDPASDWRSPTNRADYLIITHNLFVNASRRLAEHRRQDGLEVEIVNVLDIYDEFSGGQIEREAIADFIHYAYHRWERPPSYVLLMGDATYDYRNIIGGGKPSYVPSLYYQARKRGYSPSDYLYTLVDGDDLLPDLSLGRLAVSSSQQADSAVDRIIHYDTDIESGDWRSRVIFLANHHDEGQFTKPSDVLASTYTEPYGLESVKIYNPDDAPVPNATGGAFLDALNRGSLMVSFAGHGSANFMNSVLLHVPELNRDWDYLGSIHNGRKLPLVLALSCLNGMFVIPTLDSLGEAFTTMNDGGAIAYISASAASFVAQNNLLADNIYRQIFQDRQLAFGPNLNAAKVAVLAAHPSWVEAAVTMQLFGDPAQQLALPTEADYEPISLTSLTAPPVHGSPAQIEVVLRNNTRRTTDSLSVMVRGFTDVLSQPDTIAALALAGFVGTDSLTLQWPVQARGGSYRLEALVDADDDVAEIDEFNNTMSLELEILEPAVAIPIFPPVGGVVSTASLSLEAAVPLAAETTDYSVEFLVGTEHDFDALSAIAVSLPTPADRGVAVYQPELDLAVPDQLPGVELFWRARVVDGFSTGPWSDSQSFTLVSGENSSGLAESVWRQQGSHLLTGESSNLSLDPGAGGIRIAPATLPFRPGSAQREESFTVAELDGAGIVCTDGTYLYVKRWFSDDSTVYPGVDRFARIGTGFNGTETGQLYGFLSGVASSSISATYHSDGFIYNENGNAFELERLSTETGLLDTVAIPDGLLEWHSGLIESRDQVPLRSPPSHFLITSDGRYIYNVSMSSEAGIRTDWGVRVFDPADGWRLVREFTSPPTETGFTYMWTDGLLADGERIYLIEFGDGYRIRMIDAFDGRFLDEWVSEQEATYSIAGQYDWVNDKVWLGDLLGPNLYRYSGLSRPNSGTLTTDPVGPAHVWSSLEIEDAEDGVRIDVLGNESGADDGWAALAGYEDLEAPRVDLSRLDAARYPRLRLRASMRKVGEPGATLTALQLRYSAKPSLRLASVVHRSDDAGMHALVTIRNLSPFPIDDARLKARTDDGSELASSLVPPLSRGETRVVALDSIPMPALGQRLFARVETAIADADPGDNVLEIEFREVSPPAISFTLWPDGSALISGDPLRPEQAVLVAPPIDAGPGELLLMVDGQEVSPDSSLGDDRVLYRPRSTNRDHILQASFVSPGLSERYASEIRLVTTRDLVLANSLIYPNPVTGPAGFTYVLSHAAEVTVDLYSLNGRLIRQLGPRRVAAGFAETKWDGRGADGRPLANGTYLFRIRAFDDSGSAVEHRAPFVVTR